MQGVGNFLSSECANRPQGRRFERLQCSLHDPVGHAIAPGLQERPQGSRHVYLIRLIKFN
jgi:hypothetical protein